MGWKQDLELAEARSRFARGQQLAGFVLHRLVGLSVTGEIWRARHERTGNLVALRVFGLMGLPGGMETLRHEAELSRHLRHPNIVRVFGLKSSSQTAILVTELVLGRSLAQLLETLRLHGLSFPPAAALEVALGIARGLHFAWEGQDPAGEPFRIVHRDLAASKVLLSWEGGVRIRGFSVARAASDLRRTRTGVMRGEAVTMAPERLEGSKLLGPPTDLFTLGVLLWEMGTGRPFYPSNRLTTIFRTCRERSPGQEAESLGAFVPDVAPLVERLLQRDFGRRPQRAAEVVEQLETLVAVTPCEGGAAQLMDRFDVLEAIPASRPAPATCPWDAVVAAAGPLEGTARPRSTPRPHGTGQGICGRPEERAAASGGVDTTDWSALPDDESGETADWSSLEIEDGDWGD